MQRGGEAVDDPAAWWDSLPDEVTEQWKAHWQTEPWGMEWDRHAVVASKLDNIVGLLANRGLHPKHKNWHKRYEPQPPVEFMPADYLREPVKKAKKNIYEQCQEYAGATLKHGDNH